VSASSKIEWTRGDDGSAGATWNPVTGCREVSEGCEHCYAKMFAERFRGVAGHPFEQGFDVRLWPERLTLPLRWRKRRRVFVNSMSDLFFDARQVPDDFVARVFATMAATPQHTYQVLTKRPGRMASLLGDEAFRAQVAGHLFALAVGDGRVDAALLKRASNPREDWPLPNVWLGVSVENQRWARVRIPKLLQTEATARFLSCEPLLGEIDLSPWLCCPPGWRPVPNADGRGHLRPIHWVIVGGESGPGARPMHPDWARSLRDQCQAARVAFFFKQVGAWAPLGVDDAPRAADRWVEPDGRHDRRWQPGDPPPGAEQSGTVLIRRVGKGRAGRLLDGRTWDEFPATRYGELSADEIAEQLAFAVEEGLVG
jgi:protein gp37